VRVDGREVLEKTCWRRGAGEEELEKK